MVNQGAFDPTKMWIFGSGPGSSSSEPAGTTRYCAAPCGGSRASTAAAAHRAERDGEARRLRHLEGADEIAAARVVERPSVRKYVRREGGASSLPAARAMAIDQAARRTRFVRDGAAEATATQHARPRRRRRAPGWRHRGRVEALRPGVEARQTVVGELEPGRFGADEDVPLRREIWLVVGVAERQERLGSLDGDLRHLGSADRAEGALDEGRRLVAGDQVLAAQPPEALGVAVDEGGERGAVRLAAHRAVTVIVRRQRPVDFPGDATAETTAAHCALLFWRKS